MRINHVTCDIMVVVLWFGLPASEEKNLSVTGVWVEAAKQRFDQHFFLDYLLVKMDIR